MTYNAFTLPAKGIHIPQQTTKQIKQSAFRVNRNEPLCTKSDPHKQQRIEMAAI